MWKLGTQRKAPPPHHPVLHRLPGLHKAGVNQSNLGGSEPVGPREKGASASDAPSHLSESGTHIRQNWAAERESPGQQ